MVVTDAQSLIALIKEFDPSNRDQFESLKKVLEQHPNFHWVRAHYLKAVQALDPESFDKNLSHTAIATFDRELLYEFVETQTQPLKQTESRPNTKDESVVVPEENQKTVKEEIKLQPKEEEQIVDSLQSESETMRFSEWAGYLKARKVPEKQLKLNDKFELIDSFLSKQGKIIPDKSATNKEDLSEKSWTASDELMTETLAKVFVKQKKYNNALEAYQILGLKYPEKNSFFADQIKEIKRLKKLKQ
ncbi:MAG: hypothetical protein P8I75_03395 [Flavobacteriaceae bacterium]|jgi:hypothetical protein|nr:hypothetical protein [Flavobacteriaceae bacterium]